MAVCLEKYNPTAGKILLSPPNLGLGSRNTIIQKQPKIDTKVKRSTLRKYHIIKINMPFKSMLRI